VVGGAPLGSPGLERAEWLAGQDPENDKEFGWAMAGEDALSPELERELTEMAARVAVDPSTVLGNFELSEADRAQLARAEHMQIVRESITELAATGVAGWVDDDLAFVKPWGFAVDQITVPVLVRYGATDVLVPPAHGEWLAANVPGCVVKVDDTAGHLASDPVQEITESLHWLRDGVPASGSR
jgi:pimeloyl-ACP methyl ester carboxylesterase